MCYFRIAKSADVKMGIWYPVFENTGKVSWGLLLYWGTVTRLAQLYLTICRNSNVRRTVPKLVRSNVLCKHEYHSMNWWCYKFPSIFMKGWITGRGQEADRLLLISPQLAPSLWHVAGVQQSPHQHCGSNQFTVCMLMLAPTGIWNICECSAHLKIRPFNLRYFKYRLRVLNLGMQVWMFGI